MKMKVKTSSGRSYNVNVPEGQYIDISFSNKVAKLKDSETHQVNKAILLKGFNPMVESITSVQVADGASA